MFELEKLKQGTDLDVEIARYISDNLAKVAYMRVRELANETHVSPATIVRFTKKMGYSSFPEMRLVFKQELMKRKQILDNGREHGQLVQDDVFSTDFEAKLTQLTTVILAADFIHCIGLGASGIMAQYAARQLSTLGYRSFASTSAYFPYLVQTKAIKTVPKEVCLFFSVSGETIELVHLAKNLRSSPVISASITNHEGNTLSRVTDLAINYQASFDRVYYNADLSSQLPVVYFIETIIKQLYQLRQ